MGLIQAKATYVVWPLRRWSKVPSILPDNRGPLTSKECEEINGLQYESCDGKNINEESTIDANELYFTDYDSMSDCGLLPGKFGPVS